MATHGIRITKASESDFKAVRKLLSPMEVLFNRNWNGEEGWVDWSDENENKIEILSIRKQIAKEEHQDEEDVDNRLVLYEFIKNRMNACSCGEWNRVVIAAECLIKTFCDPNKNYLDWSPEIERAMENMMLGE